MSVGETGSSPSGEVKTFPAFLGFASSPSGTFHREGLQEVVPHRPRALYKTVNLRWIGQLPAFVQAVEAREELGACLSDSLSNAWGASVRVLITRIIPGTHSVFLNLEQLLIYSRTLHITHSNMTARAFLSAYGRNLWVLTVRRNPTFRDS
ncbi:hypothetical protein C8R45DRAFT_1209424 [Mycena sanguinolenta]|nr:hypothetical protein C8R45DRAFT_1209424 [Mycena sanguinolenta]